jgi:hypothetical protein
VSIEYTSILVVTSVNLEEVSSEVLHNSLIIVSTISVGGNAETAPVRLRTSIVT